MCFYTCSVGAVDGDNSVAKRSSYPHADSVYRCHPTDSKQRSWFVFDAAMVVPEYMVEFEYSLTQRRGEVDIKTPQHCNGVLNGLTSDLRGSESLSYVESLLHLSNADTLSLSRDDSYLQRAEIEKIEVSLPCHLSHELPKALRILSPDFILGENKFEKLYLQNITYLNFHDSNISRIEPLDGLQSLQVLVLCFNKISTISGLENLSKLESLDLSYNFLKKIEGINNLRSLLYLDLGGNQIWNPADLALLQVPDMQSAFPVTFCV
jgi:hypothetical protein